MIWKKRIMSWTMPTAIASKGRNLTVDMVDAIHYCGKSVYGWTANTSGAMLRIVNCWGGRCDHG